MDDAVRESRFETVRSVVGAVNPAFSGSTPKKAAADAAVQFYRWASGYSGADSVEWPLWILGAKLVRAALRENVSPGVDNLDGCDSLKYALHRYHDLVGATDATMVLSLFVKFPRPLLDREALRALLSGLKFDVTDAENLHDCLFSEPLPPIPTGGDGDRVAWTAAAANIIRGGCRRNLRKVW